MERRNLYIAIFLICLVGFTLRVLYSYGAVFGGDFVSFLETDAYNRMYYAKKIAVLMDNSLWQSILYMADNNLLFPFVIAVLSWMVPIELAGAWLPPVLGGITIFVVYLIGKELFNDVVGLLAAIFVAIIPSEFLHRSLLGFTDHHVLEVLLLCLTVWLVIKSIKTDQLLNRYSIIAGVVLALYLLNWKSGLYLAGFTLPGMLLGLFIWGRYSKAPWRNAAIGVGLIGLVALVIYLPLGGYKYLLALWPYSTTANVAVITTGEITSTILAPISVRTISETMPLFYPFGSFSMGVVLTNLHLFAITFLAGMPLLWKYRSDKAIWVFAVWTLVIIVITLNHRHFLYYLSVNVAIISALFIWQLARQFKGNVYANIMVLSLPLFIISMPLAKAVGAHQRFRMNTEWHNALAWLEEQPQGDNVTAWSDYGHWIQYVSGKTPSYMPGPGGDMVARIFLTTDDNEAKALMDKLHTDYLIVDKHSLTATLYALQIYARVNADKQNSLAFRLYYQNKAPPFLEPVYQGEGLKIYHYSGGT